MELVEAPRAELARGWEKLGYDLGLGIGIATGYATLGRIGFEGRYDYGAVDNVVILAARLGDAAAAGDIFLSQRTHGAIEDWLRNRVRARAAVEGI